MDELTDRADNVKTVYAPPPTHTHTHTQTPFAGVIMIAGAPHHAQIYRVLPGLVECDCTCQNNLFWWWLGHDTTLRQHSNVNAGLQSRTYRKACSYKENINQRIHAVWPDLDRRSMRRQWLRLDPCVEDTWICIWNASVLTVCTYISISFAVHHLRWKKKTCL